MPTPFSHLWIAHRMLADSRLADVSLLTQHLPDFLLGSVAADARPDTDSPREATHFYRYDRPINGHIWRTMFDNFPELHEPQSDAHRAFLAGYVGHLAVDEYWSLNMLKPHFAEADWGGSLKQRFTILHYLLIYMDERDEDRLPPDYPALLKQSEPDEWLPFLPDDTLRGWRDYIADQIIGDSETVEIFGGRINIAPDDIRGTINDSDSMQAMLWDHIPLDLLHEIEGEMFRFAVEQTCIFLND